MRIIVRIRIMIYEGRRFGVVCLFMDLITSDIPIVKRPQPTHVPKSFLNI